jgi:hypothetical protein
VYDEATSAIPAGTVGDVTGASGGTACGKCMTTFYYGGGCTALAAGKDFEDYISDDCRHCGKNAMLKFCAKLPEQLKRKMQLADELGERISQPRRRGEPASVDVTQKQRAKLTRFKPEQLSPEKLAALSRVENPNIAFTAATVERDFEEDAKCVGCVEAFEAAGGCRLVTQRQDPAAVIPDGCDGCGRSCLGYCRRPGSKVGVCFSGCLFVCLFVCAAVCLRCCLCVCGAVLGCSFVTFSCVMPPSGMPRHTCAFPRTFFVISSHSLGDPTLRVTSHHGAHRVAASEPLKDDRRRTCLQGQAASQAPTTHACTSGGLALVELGIARGFEQGMLVARGVAGSRERGGCGGVGHYYPALGGCVCVVRPVPV